jgi:hypothetical protein
MKKFILILIFILIYCGSGPAEDRAERNCKNGLFLTIVLTNQFSDNGSKIAALTLQKNSCNDTSDSLINRYYRGYVLDKE